MRKDVMAENSPPVREALLLTIGAAGRKDENGGDSGKPSETAGRKAKGTKAALNLMEPGYNGTGTMEFEFAMSAWPLIIKGKPPETTGRKARELKR